MDKSNESSSVVQLIITDEQYELLKEKAKKMGLKPSTYGRLVIITIMEQGIVFTPNMAKALEKKISSKTTDLTRNHVNFTIPTYVVESLDERVAKLGLKNRADYLRLLLFNSSLKIKVI